MNKAKDRSKQRRRNGRTEKFKKGKKERLKREGTWKERRKEGKRKKEGKKMEEVW